MSDQVIRAKLQQEAIKALKMMGKCASVERDGGKLCTLTANHKGRNHMTQVLGGEFDGQVLAEWPW